MPVEIEGWGGDQALRGQVRRVEPPAFTRISALGVEEQRVNVITSLVDPPAALGDGFRIDARIITWRADRVLVVPQTSSCIPATACATARGSFSGSRRRYRGRPRPRVAALPPIDAT